MVEGRSKPWCRHYLYELTDIALYASIVLAMRGGGWPT